MPEPISIGFDLPFEEAIAAARARKVVLPMEYYGLVAGETRRVAITVSGLAGLDQIQAVLDSVNRALAEGQSLADWQRIAKLQHWGLSPGRLETILRTNVQTAYSAGHWRAFEATKASRPYLMWSAINDSRVRPAHLAMDGYIAPIGDAIWRVWHPPAGYNCRCSQVSLTHEQAVARGYPGQERPAVQPDPGFGNAQPGDPGATIAQVQTARAAELSSELRRALDELTRARPPQPSGPPVSAALALAKGRSALAKELQETLAIIDKVHGDGQLPEIPVRMSATTRKNGEYRYFSIIDKPIEIAVSRNSDHPRLTFAHEVGHFLDHKGWGARGYSSANEAAAQAWRTAVMESTEVKRLLELKRTAAAAGTRAWARYATSWQELWARSYAQWVAERSGDTKMLQELTSVKTWSPPQPYRSASMAQDAYRSSQWGMAEFEPIGKAIDGLFTLLKWRTP